MSHCYLKGRLKKSLEFAALRCRKRISLSLSVRPCHLSPAFSQATARLIAIFRSHRLSNTNPPVQKVWIANQPQLIIHHGAFLFRIRSLFRSRSLREMLRKAPNWGSLDLYIPFV